MMLRELHEVVSELQSSVAPLAAAAHAGVRLRELEMTLPLDMVAMFRGGGCTLLADVPRNLADASWNETPTRLHLTLGAVMADVVPQWHGGLSEALNGASIPQPSPSIPQGERVGDSLSDGLAESEEMSRAASEVHAEDKFPFALRYRRVTAGAAMTGALNGASTPSPSPSIPQGERVGDSLSDGIVELQKMPRAASENHAEDEFPSEDQSPFALRYRRVTAGAASEASTPQPEHLNGSSRTTGPKEAPQ